MGEVHQRPDQALHGALLTFYYDGRFGPGGEIPSSSPVPITWLPEGNM